jgi:hypothetical protein
MKRYSLAWRVSGTVVVARCHPLVNPVLVVLEVLHVLPDLVIVETIMSVTDEPVATTTG